MKRLQSFGALGLISVLLGTALVAVALQGFSSRRVVSDAQLPRTLDVSPRDPGGRSDLVGVVTGGPAAERTPEA